MVHLCMNRNKTHLDLRFTIFFVDGCSVLGDTSSSDFTFDNEEASFRSFDCRTSFHSGSSDTSWSVNPRVSNGEASGVVGSGAAGRLGVSGDNDVDGVTVGVFGGANALFRSLSMPPDGRSVLSLDVYILAAEKLGSGERYSSRSKAGCHCLYDSEKVSNRCLLPRARR
ncbi:hypothetical protein BKA93DRAFT_42836 [Sparassis latifolia]